MDMNILHTRQIQPKSVYGLPDVTDLVENKITLLDWLSAIEERAGASDTDTEAWLAERRQGVTATEVANLALGNCSPDSLGFLKISPSEPWEGNVYTRWGKEREPIIASMVTEMYPMLKHESRVFKGLDSPRHLASPDMLGMIDGVPTLAEIKTSSKQLRPGTRLFIKTGYYEQMQWQMHVLGAEQCLFVTEQHFNFKPLPLYTEMVKRDDATIEKLIVLADKTLKVLDEYKSLLEKSGAHAK